MRVRRDGSHSVRLLEIRICCHLQMYPGVVELCIVKYHDAEGCIRKAPNLLLNFRLCVKPHKCKAQVYRGVVELCVVKYRDAEGLYVGMREAAFCALRGQLLMALHDAGANELCAQVRRTVPKRSNHGLAMDMRLLCSRVVVQSLNIQGVVPLPVALHNGGVTESCAPTCALNQRDKKIQSQARLSTMAGSSDAAIWRPGVAPRRAVIWRTEKRNSFVDFFAAGADPQSGVDAAMTARSTRGGCWSCTTYI